MPGRKRANALVQPIPQSSAVLGRSEQFVRQQAGIGQTPVLSHPGSRTGCQNNVALKQPREGPPVHSTVSWFRTWRETAFVHSPITSAGGNCPQQVRLSSLARRSRCCLMSPGRQSAGWAAVPCLLCLLFLGTCHCPQPSQAQIS